jgi:hypothetical protein
MNQNPAGPDTADRFLLTGTCPAPVLTGSVGSFTKVRSVDLQNPYFKSP